MQIRSTATSPAALSEPRKLLDHSAFWLALLAASCFIAYVPTLVKLIEGPWQTEQEGHGPVIIAGSLWLIWRARFRLQATPIGTAPVLGWTTLVIGLAMMFVSRTQGTLSVEVFSALIVAWGCILLAAGTKILRVVAAPLALLFFVVPAPHWILDAVTVPLKVWISDTVTWLLYALDYPIAQNGVMIMIGPYEVLVKDACSGMNSVFVLSAIGFFYAYAFRSDSKIRCAILLLATVPIAIAANFVRVLTLVLITFYFGVDALEGPIHPLTGIILFVVATGLLYLFDESISGVNWLYRRFAPRGKSLKRSS